MKKILIVDDEDLIRSLYSEFILSEYKDCQISEAADGEIAKKMCFKEKFNLILLDHKMPNMTGSEFIEFIRNAPNMNRTTNTIMITAYMPKLSADSDTNDNTLYLEKPINFEKLKKYLKMLLR